VFVKSEQHKELIEIELQREAGESMFKSEYKTIDDAPVMKAYYTFIIDVHV